MGSLSDNSTGSYYAYRISKAALNMFCRSLSKDFPTIISSVIHPGWVKTDMGGPNATLSIEESASGVVNKIISLNKKDSGEFFNYKGDKLSW